MLNKKEWQLLQLFEGHPDVYLTSQLLSEQMGYSDKTIRKYVNQLADILMQKGGLIERVQGHGYKFRIIDRAQFLVFMNAERQSQQMCTNVTELEEQGDRQRYILNRLFFEEVSVTVPQLAQMLYVSRTTITTLLTGIRQLLIKYHLSLENIGNQGMSIVGKERDKRRFMMDYFFTRRYETACASYVGSTFIAKAIRIEELTIIVLDECREAGLKLSDYVIHNLVLHLALAIQRLRAGFPLDTFPLSEEISQSEEYMVALGIIQRIEDSLGITFPKEEANYIALHLKVRTMPYGIFDTNIVEIPDEMMQQLENAVVLFSSELGLDLSGDSVLLNGLYAHFTPLLVRLRNQVKFENPLLRDIQQRYSRELVLTRRAFAQLPVFQEYEMSEGEWAYIALHLIAAIERYHTKRRKRILVICATGYGSAQMLKTRLETEFGSQIHIVDVISYYEITEDLLKGIDVIVSSISLATIVLPVPVIHVSVFLAEEDIRKVRKYLGATPDRMNQPIVRQSVQVNEASALFDRIFSHNRFLWLGLRQQRTELLEQMVACLQQESSGFASQMLWQIELREAMGPVVFGETMAFPHPATPISTQAQVVVALCPQGVCWNDEQRNVRVVCLMSPSQGRNQDVVYVSRAFVQLVQSAELQHQLMNVRHFAEFRQLFIPLIEQELNK